MLCSMLVVECRPLRTMESCLKLECALLLSISRRNMEQTQLLCCQTKGKARVGYLAERESYLQVGE